jgi:oligosaccharyltransferase complex subunit delta (ribophorin II)
MRVLGSLLRAAALLLCSQSALAATSWTFSDATITVQGKGSGVGSGLKEKCVQAVPQEFSYLHHPRLTPDKTLSSAVKLGASDTLKIILTTQEGKSAKRPHQAFLLLTDSSSKLDVSFPFSVKESGKAKVDLVSHLPSPVNLQ